MLTNKMLGTRENTMYCSQCGTQLPAEAKYCPSCGVKAAIPTGRLQNRESEQSDTYEAKPDPISQESVQQALEVRPWVRFWARMFDVALFSLPAGFLLGALFPNAFVEPGIDQLLGLLLQFLWVFVEAGLLSAFGTTPGKALFRISLIKTVKGGFDYGDGLSRSLKVWWRGLGIGFPIVTLITMVVAYSKLSNNRRTTWDADEGVIVKHGEIGPLRVLFAIAFFAILFLFIMVSSAMYA